jgi:simple sugar transport system substrate-binding protein
MKIQKSLLAVLACAGAVLSSGPSSAAADNPRFTVIIYDTTGNPFWSKVVAGVNEAAKAFNVNVDTQFANNDPVQQNNAIEAAMASKVQGIGLAINVPNAYDQNIKRAIAAGIPVVVFNIDDPKGAAGSARLSFIGQSFQSAGYAIGKRMVDAGALKKGSHVVCPVEHPEATYAAERYAGVKRALDEAGVTSEILDTGAIGLEDTVNKIDQYLLGKPDTAAVIGLGQLPTEAAPQAIKEANLNIPTGGFDLSKAILQNILDGKTVATVDQQPFYQGFLTVTELYYRNKYGLVPVDVNTGSALIDKSNAAVALQFADTTR